MSELDLRLHCLTLAIQHLYKQANHQIAAITAEQFYNFLAPGIAGRGIERDAANVHATHRTLQ